jgi:hypothetical protein
MMSRGNRDEQEPSCLVSPSCLLVNAKSNAFERLMTQRANFAGHGGDTGHGLQWLERW